MLDFHMPVKVYAGENCFRTHQEEVCSFGKRCLIVTDAVSGKLSGALADVTAVLDAHEVAWTLFDEITPNPALTACQQAGKLAADADFIIGIGGGSAMDAAKATSVFAANPTLNEAAFYNKEWANRPLPIVLVGTTSGTGSEVTNVAVLTDSRLRKHSIHDPRMYAALAIGDPAYTRSMPLAVTLSTGIDVLAHCMESYFCKKANEISRAFAIRGIRLLSAPLLAAAEGQELSLAQRGQLYEASILGGLAICVTGTAFPHNVGYYLTETYHVPHGTACAVFLPDLLTHVRECDPAYTDAFFSSLGLTEAEVRTLIEKSLPALDIHMTEAEIDTALPRWENNGSVKNTLGQVNTEDIRRILAGKFAN